MDVILSVIWPGLISAVFHGFSLHKAIGARRKGGKKIAIVAVALCLFAILLAPVFPFYLFAIALNVDYLCTGQTFGLNTCLLLKWLPFPVLLTSNFITWMVASRAAFSVLGNDA